VTIEVKFVEIGQDDAKALGFDWYVGNIQTANGNIGISGGTAPSYAGAPSEAIPTGVPRQLRRSSDSRKPHHRPVGDGWVA
jgi:type II secretory pathway component GspD/PulD (secretin)